MKLFGTSGIRRIADRELVELALKVGMAVGSLYESVVVGSDTRTSGGALSEISQKLIYLSLLRLFYP